MTRWWLKEAAAALAMFFVIGALTGWWYLSTPTGETRRAEATIVAFGTDHPARGDLPSNAMATVRIDDGNMMRVHLANLDRKCRVGDTVIVEIYAHSVRATDGKCPRHQ